MRIAWITVRRWADFCSTTTDALVHGLVKKGHTLTLFNADEHGSHSEAPWDHVALSQSTVPGRRAATLAKSGYTWFKQHTKQQFDVIIIDWPLVSPLGTFLSSMGYPLVLMDGRLPLTHQFWQPFSGESGKRPGGWSPRVCSRKELQYRRSIENTP